MVCMIDPPVNPKPERNTSSIQFDVHCARRSGLMMTSILTALSALGTIVFTALVVVALMEALDAYGLRR